jgi:hypothetical protein
MSTCLVLVVSRKTVAKVAMELFEGSCDGAL